MRIGVHFVSMCILYVLLSGQIHSLKLMSLGFLGCGGLTLLIRRLGLIDAETLPLGVLWRGLPHLPWILAQIIRSNIDVARRVWSPRLPISPCFVRVPHGLQTPVGVTAYANTITLTPGTVTAQVGAHQVVVHALSAEAADALFDGSLEERIKKIEGSAG